MGTTSLTFQISGVSELIGYIDKIQGKMAGLDQSMSKAQLSTEMSRVERLLKEAGTFANTLYTALQKVEQTNIQKTADGLKAVGKESVDASGKVAASSKKMSDAMTKSTEAVKKAASTHANAHKSVGNSALSAGKIMDSFTGSITSVVTGYASIQTVLTAVNAAFQEHARVMQEAQTSMQRYAEVSGQLGQKAENKHELGEYRRVVDRLATTGAVKDRAEATEIAYAMLSANMPISEVEKMILPLQAGLFSSSDLSGIIRAAGPLMNYNKDVNLNQLMSMAAAGSKGNVSDTAKIVQSVAASESMNQQLGTTLEESFAIADVIARATPNADEAKTWQKNFTKDVWKRVLAKAAMAKMQEIDPNAKTMEGFITGYDSKGNPILDPNFRMTFTEFGEWAKGYYGGDMSRVKQDFADIRGSQGALAVINALMDGSFEQSLAQIRRAKNEDIVTQKSKTALEVDNERRVLVQQRSAQATSDIQNEADAAIETIWKAEKQYYQSSAKTSAGRTLRGWGNWFDSGLNPDSYSQRGKVEHIWRSPYIPEEQKLEAVYQYARANPEITDFERGRRSMIRNGTAYNFDTGVETAIYNAKLQIAAGATQYTPVAQNIELDDDKVVDRALNPPKGPINPFAFIDKGMEAVKQLQENAQKAADALNETADSAEKATQKLQNQVLPTPGQSGQLTPATL